MPRIISRINTGSDDFAANREHNLALKAELQARLAHIAHGGGEAAEAKLRSQGKLPVSERIARLPDPGSPALEPSPPPALDRYGAHVPAAGCVRGARRV